MAAAHLPITFDDPNRTDLVWVAAGESWQAYNRTGLLELAEDHFRLAHDEALRCANWPAFVALRECADFYGDLASKVPE